MSECIGLTDRQMRTVNGCGSSAWYAWIFRIPRWFDHDFYCACNKHDIIYQSKIVKSLSAKRRADDDLVNAMYASAMTEPSIIKSWLKLLLAEITYHALNSIVSEWCWRGAKR